MKRSLAFLSLIILMAFTLGCQDQQALAELEEMKVQAEVEEQNKEMVVRLYENIDKQKFEEALAAFAPDAKMYGFGGNGPANPQELRPIFPMWFTAFPDYTHHIHDVVTQGSKVVARIMYSGTHEGDFFGAPPTGEPIEYLGIHVHTIEDGKITESWVLEDMLVLWQQLGMELQPAAVEE